jgi:two-component system sensor histidine kinase MprB
VKLRTRIAIIAAFAVTIGVVGASVGAYFLARNEMRNQVDESLIEIASETRNLRDVVSAFTGSFRPRRPGVTERAFDVVLYQVLFPDGRAFIPREQETVLPVSDATVAIAEGESQMTVLADVTTEDGQHLRVVSSPLTDVDGALQVARSLDEVDEALQGLTAVLVIVSIGGAVLAGVLGLVVARSALRPLGRLTRAAEHVAETQELESHIEVDREDEVGRLAEAFNAMLAALEQSRIQQQRLVRDAGHELRTPLTALRTNVEVLARAEGMPPEDRRELLADVTLELGELSNLVTELVDLAIDPGSAEEPVVNVRLDEIVERVADRYRRRSNTDIRVVSEDSCVTGRPAMLERAVSNLVDNATKWNTNGKPIEVTVAAGTVSVRDHGPGISDEDKPRIFDRFYRADTARTKPGSGLGLSIVKLTANEHDGSVFIDDADGGGAVVGFTIPTDSEPSAES